MKTELSLIAIALTTIFLSLTQDHLVFIDKEFNPYVNRFKEYAIDHHRNIDLNNLSIYFGKLDKTQDIIGQCDYRTKTILISREDWKQGTDDYKEQLMLHELGHCILDRTHDDGVIQDENLFIPHSLMKSVGINDDGTYEKHKQYYVNELFDGDGT